MENKSNHNGNDTESEFPPIFVGQVLYLDRKTQQGIMSINEVIVAKVGTKYFYVKYGIDGSVDIDRPVDKKTLIQKLKNYSQSATQLYRDKQEILDKREKDKRIHLLRQYFNKYGKLECTLEQLRKIFTILQIEEKIQEHEYTD